MKKRDLFLIPMILLVCLFTWGNEEVYIKAPTNQTFSASAVLFTPYATAQDVCTITSGLKMWVYRVRLWGTQTTVGVNSWYLLKRSAADTGGALSPLTTVPRDSKRLLSFATVSKVTAAPTPGTLIGTITGNAIASLAPGGAGNSFYDFEFGPTTGVQPIVLYPNETLALNFGGAAIPTGMSVSCEFTWSESQAQ